MDFCFKKGVDPFLMNRKNRGRRIHAPSSPSVKKARACQGDRVLSIVGGLGMVRTGEARIELALVLADESETVHFFTV